MHVWDDITLQKNQNPECRNIPKIYLEKLKISERENYRKALITEKIYIEEIEIFRKL